MFLPNPSNLVGYELQNIYVCLEAAKVVVPLFSLQDLLFFWVLYSIILCRQWESANYLNEILCRFWDYPLYGFLWYFSSQFSVPDKLQHCSLFPQPSETAAYYRIHLYPEDLRDILTGRVWYLLNLPSIFSFFQGSDPFLTYPPCFSCSTMPSNARLLHFVQL